jgi:hypothetical protein
MWLANIPLLSLSAKNNQERLEHKTFTKNPDFSHSVRKEALKCSLYLQLKIWLLFLFAQSDRREIECV